MTVTRLVAAALRKKEMAVLRCRNPASNLRSLIDSCSLTHSLTHPTTHPPNKSDPLFIPATCPSSSNSVSIYSISAASTTSTPILPFLISCPYATSERKLGRLSDELRILALWHVYFFTSFFPTFFPFTYLCRTFFSYFLLSLLSFFPATFFHLPFFILACFLY